MNVVDGAVVQLECRVEGEPRPTITWFRQTAIIKPSTDFQVTNVRDSGSTAGTTETLSFWINEISRLHSSEFTKSSKKHGCS